MSTKKNTVTCSFIMDRDIYNAYKSIVVMNGENVKEDPDKKTYNSFAEIMKEINNE